MHIFTGGGIKYEFLQLEKVIHSIAPKSFRWSASAGGGGEKEKEDRFGYQVLFGSFNSIQLFNLFKKKRKHITTNNNNDPRSELVKDQNNKKLKMKKREKKKRKKKQG